MCITKCILKHKIFYFTIKNISRISTINQITALFHLTGNSFEDATIPLLLIIQQTLKQLLK